MLSLHYRGNQSAWGSLAGVLGTCTSIASVVVNGRQDGAERCKFWKAVRDRPSIRSIRCRPPNKFGTSAHDEFINTISAHPGIEELSLELGESSERTAIFWQVLCDSILENPCGRIKKLRLDNLSLTAAEASHLVRLVVGSGPAEDNGAHRPCTKLQELRICDTSDGIEHQAS